MAAAEEQSPLLGLARAELDEASLTDLPQDLQAKVRECVDLFNNDKTLEAGKALAVLDAEAPSACDSLRTFLGSDTFLGIRKICDEQRELLQLLRSSDGWNMVKESTCRRNVKVFHRSEPDSALHGFKVEATIRAPLKNCLTLVNEIDLYGQWLPFLTRTEEVERFHRNSRVAIIEWRMMWPMWWRDFCVRGVATDAFDSDDGVLVSVKSFDNQAKPGAAPLYPPRRGVCRIDVKYGALLLRPVSAKEVSFSAIMHVDPKLAILPTSLINWAATYVGYWGLLYFERRARALGRADPATDPHLLKAVENREFYDEMDRRLREYKLRVSPADVDVEDVVSESDEEDFGDEEVPGDSDYSDDEEEEPPSDRTDDVDAKGEQGESWSSWAWSWVGQ